MNQDADRIPKTEALAKSSESLKILLFSFSGRIGRSAYWGILVICVAIPAIVVLLDKAFASPARYGEPVPGESIVAVALGWMISFVGLWLLLATTAKRLHDIGYSGWFALGVPLFTLVWLGVVGPGCFIQLLNLVWFGVIGCCPGTAGRNKYGYGPDPLIALEYNYINHKAEQGDVGRIESMLAAKPELVNARDADGNTPLLGAALGGHKDVVELLVAKSGQVNSRNEDGFTPLHCAAQEGFKDLVEFLVSRGAEVNAKTNKGSTPLQCALKRGHNDVAELLRQHGAIE